MGSIDSGFLHRVALRTTEFHRGNKISDFSFSVALSDFSVVLCVIEKTYQNSLNTLIKPVNL